MSKKSVLLILLVCMFIVPLVSATSSSVDLQYTFKQGNESSISRPCFNTGTNGWCSAAAVCQLTVYDPDNNIFILGRNMTNQISIHNFTTPSLIKSGIYKADMACSDANQTGYDTFFFGVNPSGKNYNENIAPWILLSLFIIMMAVFIILSIYMDTALKMFFITLVFILIPTILWFGLDISRNTYMGESVISVLSTGFMISLTLLVGFFLYLCFSIMMQIRIKKTIGIQKQPGNPAYWQKRQESKKRHEGEEYG